MLNTREICKQALLKLLRPVVRFAVRRSIKIRDLTAFVKLAYIQVAQEELEDAGASITVSKLSAMTGIQRRDIDKLRLGKFKLTHTEDVVSRVIGLWLKSKKYQDKNGKPKILELKSRSGDFAKLVACVSTDLNPYTIAFELERVGIAKSTQLGIKLLKDGYEPTGDISAGLALLAEDCEILHSAVYENVFNPKQQLNLHVKTMYDNIPASKLNEVRQWFSEQGGKLHAEAREYLSRLDCDINPKNNDTRTDEQSIKAVLGSFSWTENN